MWNGMFQGKSIVSIHVPTRGTTKMNGRHTTSLRLFQSTFPQGERHDISLLIVSAFRVSIHVPTRGTTSSGIWSLSFLLFQSTFPQGERRPRCQGTGESRRVSIHVPTRGTTQVLFLCIHLHCSFNPRSHKGNDRSAAYESRPFHGFNPRSHKGNDQTASVKI